MYLQLISPHIAQEQPVNVSGRPLDMPLPGTSHKCTVHRQQHLCPMAHAFRKGWEGEIYEQSVAAPPACLHSVTR